MAFKTGVYEYRVDGEQVQVRVGGSRLWEPATRQSLLAYDVDSPLWDWLRQNGITRPSPSGQTAEAERPNVQVKLRLEEDIAERLEYLATAAGMTKSAYVAELILRADQQGTPKPSRREGARARVETSRAMRPEIVPKR